MEMEMEMDSLSFCKHHHQNPPLSPSSGGQEAFSSSSSSYCYYHPTEPYPAAAAAMVDENRRDVGPTATPPPSSRPRSAAERKDRHSKICTAGGMRDRRMRLSLDVARRFFSLQDKLGFDKASKTVQWLLDMSTVGISHLLAASTTSMSMSEEDGSGSVLLDSNDHVMVADAETNTCKQQQAPKGRRRAGRKSSINGAPALLPDKESRARARQRARERTMERNRIQSSVAVEEVPVPVPAPALTRQIILPVTPSNFGSYCEDQEPWELGGVVFAKPRQR